MKISIFGGSGFIGYDFVRHLLAAEEEINPTVYSTNAGSLTNLSRHDIDIRLIHYGQLEELELPANTEYLINFTHPFGTRDKQTPKQQISGLLRFFRRQLESLPHLKLIHISSMSVYEPFASHREFGEQDKIDPPKSDLYARNKADIDNKILSWPSAQDRILLLRPTVVYGPFGIPWTDNIIKQFRSGSIRHFGLRGKIQPLWVSDISRFLLRNVKNFNSGIYNIAGPETTTWKSFLTFFEELMGKGNLRQIPSIFEVPPQKNSQPPNKPGSTLKAWIFNPFVREVATPFFRPLPESIKQPLKKLLFPNENSAAPNNKQPAPGPYLKVFFEEDRLVCTTKIKENFPDFKLTPLTDMNETMRRYIDFRFPDS